MKLIWEFDDPKTYLLHWLETVPRKRHGMNARIAELLNVHTTMVSHILKGNAQLNVEQALKLSHEFFLHAPIETRYFVLLVQRDRAANQDTRKFFTDQIEELRARSFNLNERITIPRNLELKDQAVFYSDWYYSGIRLATALPGKHTVATLASRFGLSVELVKNVTDFLVEIGLIKVNNDLFTIGEEQTYISRDSVFVNRHHVNWRLKTLALINSNSKENLSFTNPVTLSPEDFIAVRELLIDLIKEFRHKTEMSPPEELACLTLDWIKIDADKN